MLTIAQRPPVTKIDPQLPGFLFIEAEPGPLITRAEFDDWYDNEHLPLRMNFIPEFLLGSRYTAMDGMRPSYLCCYNVASYATFSAPQYTQARGTHSEKEIAFMASLELIERRISTRNHESSPAVKSAFVPQYLVSIAGSAELDVKSDFSSITGWKRSYSSQTFDSTKFEKGKEPVWKAVPEFIMIHEFDSEDFVHSKEWKAILGREVNARRWKLHKAVDNTALVV